MRAPRIVFEGANGTGKTTLISYVTPILREMGHKVVIHTQPSQITEGGKKARWLLDNRVWEDPKFFDKRLLSAFMSDRIELSTIEKEYLEEGTIVISSRCWLSSKVYQGYLGYTSWNDWRFAYDHYKSQGGLDPDITVFLRPHPDDLKLCYVRAHPDVSRVEDFEHYHNIVESYEFCLERERKNLGNVITFDNRAFKEAVLNTLIWAIRVYYKKQEVQ